MSKLYLMTGLSGSGKTTFAKEFAKKHNLLYLNPDDFYSVVNNDSTEKGHKHEFQVWMMLWQAIHCAEISNKNVIIDTNAPTPCKREQFLDWFGFDENHLIYIFTDFKTCYRNNLCRNRQIPTDVFLETCREYKRPEIDEIKPRWDTFSIYSNKDNNYNFELKLLYNRKKNCTIEKQEI